MQIELSWETCPRFTVLVLSSDSEMIPDNEMSGRKVEC